MTQQTTPREALKFLEFDNGGAEKVVLASPDAILTALAPHLRTPGTVEVCVKYEAIGCKDHSSGEWYNKCEYKYCPLKVTNEKA